MGDPKHEISKEVIPFIGKLVAWASYIAIGLMAKFAFDMKAGKLTVKQIMIKSALSIFAGVMAGFLCEIIGHPEKQKLVVPVATLLGEGLVGYLMSNWQAIVSKILPAWFQKGKQTKS